MKIAFLSRVSRSFDHQTLEQAPLGGTQAALLHLTRELAALGHDVHIFAQGAQSQTQQGVHYHPLLQLARFARQQTLDAFVPVSDEQALKLGIPARLTLAWLHNDYAYLRHELTDVRTSYAHLLATRCDRVIAVSHWQKQALQSIFALPPEHVEVLSNGIYPPYFASPPQPASPPRLLFTAVPSRGLKRLLELFPRIQQTVPELELHLYSRFSTWGMSPEQDEAAAGALYALARSLPQVFLHDPVPPARLGEILAAGTLWVYPQHPSEPLPGSPQIWDDTESFCLAALEAQAAGLPVVTSARGGLPESVAQGQSGILIPGDPLSAGYAEAFVAACVELLQDAARRQKMAQAARQRALADFDWAMLARGWETLLANGVSTRQAQVALLSDFVSPEISVIIPTYNRARNLKNCLESLTWQDFKAFEVIVCDDGSSDETREVAESYRERLNLRYRWQADEGFRAAEARNMGLRIARGKLLVFLDSDLVVPATFLRAHLEAHAAHPNVVVNSYVHRMLDTCDDDLGLPPEQYIPRHRERLKPDNRDRYELFERQGLIEETYFLDSNALSLSRKLLHELGGFDADFVGWGHEDTELGYRVARYGIRLLMLKAGAEAYHQYHYVPENKDEERAVNWQRLAHKYAIDKWYHPLWVFPVLGQVQLAISGSGPADALLPTFVEAAWELKTGHAAPIANLHYLLQVEQGRLQAIVPHPCSVPIFEL